MEFGAENDWRLEDYSKLSFACLSLLFLQCLQQGRASRQGWVLASASPPYA